MTSARIEKLVLWLGSALLLAVIVWPRIMSGLAIDESGSWWIVKEDFGQAVKRSWFWSATSPFYYSALWFWTRIFGLGELGMRLLSLLFALAAVWLVYRLALRWLDESGSRLTAIVFLAVPAMTVAFIDIRPYAMGLALCAAAWVSMQRWLERDRPADGLLFAVCAAATVWCHYTLALGLLPLVWYVPRLGVKRTFYAAALLSLLLAPLAIQMMDLVGHRRGISYGSTPSLWMLAMQNTRNVYWMILAGGSLMALSAVTGRRCFELPRLKQPWAPVALLAVSPVTFLWLVGQLDSTPMFHDRYMLTAWIGVAVAGAWLISGIQPQLLRALFIAIFVTKFALAGVAKPHHHLHSDWRALTAWGANFIAANPGVKVALVSPFVESLKLRVLNDARYEEILHGPFARYLGTGKGVLLPFSPTVESTRRLDLWLSAPAGECVPLLYLEASGFGENPKWLMPRLAQRGYRLTEERSFGDGRAWVFTACGGEGHLSMGRK